MQPDLTASPSPQEGETSSTREPTPAESTAGAGDESGILDEAARCYEEGRLAASAARDSLSAIRALAAAEWLLARAAVARAALLLAGALCAAVVATLFVFATLAVGLVAVGLSWPLALAIPAFTLAAGAAWLLWQGLAVLKLAQFSNTRDQFTRLRGIRT